MLSNFDRDAFTVAGHGVRSAQLNTWQSIHHAWLPEEPMLPLTADKVRNVAAHLKHAGYRAWNNYAGRANEEHVASGHAWSLLLETCFRKARRSVLRGIWALQASRLA